jgi:hypothetical protein
MSIIHEYRHIEDRMTAATKALEPKKPTARKRKEPRSVLVIPIRFAGMDEQVDAIITKLKIAITPADRLKRSAAR